MKTILLSGNDIPLAAGMIREGKLVIFPTETVYGLGADAMNGGAVKNIFLAKGRPQDNPIIAHLAAAEDAEKYCFTCPMFYRIAERFMPGPLTVILPKRECVPDEITCCLPTLAVRVPSNSIAHSLIEQSGTAIAAPSANLSGKPSPTTLRAVLEDMDGRVDAVIDGGDCDIGVESTVIKLEEDGILLLRPGRITIDDLKTIAPVRVSGAVTERLAEGETAISPGMKYRHYAPEAKVILLRGDESKIKEFLRDAAIKSETGVICFDDDLQTVYGEYVRPIGRRDDLEMQARKLFDALRSFNGTGVRTVYARLPEKEGIGLAIYNRLIKAAGYDVRNL